MKGAKQLYSPWHCSCLDVFLRVFPRLNYAEYLS